MNYLNDGFIFDKKEILKDFNNLVAEDQLPDSYGCDYVFQTTFVTPEMADDIIEMAPDFLVKELSNMPKYSKIDYYFARTDLLNTDQIYVSHVLSFMVNAYRSGSEYAGKTLLLLYKKYYKKEYNQLKRFSTMSLDELMGFVNSEYTMPPDTARVLFFAEMMGIRREREIAVIYLLLNRVSVFKEQYFDEITSKDAEWAKKIREKQDEAKDAIAKLFPDRQELMKQQKKWVNSADNALRFFGFEPDFLDFSNSLALGYYDTLEVAYLLIKSSMPKKKITGDEVLLYAELMHAIGAAGSNREALEYILDEFPYMMEDSAPDEVKEKKEEGKPKVVVTQETTDIEKEELVSMISELRRKVHEKESEIKQYRSDLQQYKSTVSELQNTKEQLRDAENELASLRSYVYGLTQDDLPKKEIPVDDMKAFLKKKKIVIIGGHSNWSSKIKNLFPDWTIIKPSPSGTVETTPVENADYVFFFTDIISHSTYERYINVLRTKKIPFGYLHGVNVDDNIRYIYGQLEE